MKSLDLGADICHHTVASNEQLGLENLSPFQY